jgi:hypothetical protein
MYVSFSAFPIVAQRYLPFRGKTLSYQFSFIKQNYMKSYKKCGVCTISGCGVAKWLTRACLKVKVPGVILGRAMGGGWGGGAGVHRRP